MHSASKARRDARRKRSKPTWHAPSARRRKSKSSKSISTSSRSRTLISSTSFTTLANARLRRPRRTWRSSACYERRRIDNSPQFRRSILCVSLFRHLSQEKQYMLLSHLQPRKIALEQSCIVSVKASKSSAGACPAHKPTSLLYKMFSLN